MKAITYKKIGMRYAILMVLAMTLTIEAKPNPASTLKQCESACMQTDATCRAGCNGNGVCLSDCSFELTQCRQFCASGV
jgi:hypothetical protein